MPLKTEGIRLLVQDVLRTLPQPYGEDVIEDVFVAIEHKAEWRRRYADLEAEIPVINNWIGWHTRSLTGFDTLMVVEARRSTLIKYYSKLIPARS